MRPVKPRTHPYLTVLRLKLTGNFAKFAFLSSAIVVTGSLTIAVISVFGKSVAADPRLMLSSRARVDASERYPWSARLHAAAASSELLDSSRDLQRAEYHTRQAVELSPYKYSYRVLLASVLEAARKRPEAERELRQAIRLAPNNTDLHWRLANLLLRQKKLDLSLEEFRVVTDARPTLLPTTLDLIWSTSHGDSQAVRSVVSTLPSAQLALARFLVGHSQIQAGCEVFAAIDRQERLKATETAAFFQNLLAREDLNEARRAWTNLLGDGERIGDPPLIWNGSFENPAPRDLDHFDWRLAPSDFAKVAIDNSRARNGRCSLRIDLLGRDTTRLEHEMRQRGVVASGKRYHVEFYVAAERFITPEGPRVVVVDRSNVVRAFSEPVPAGSYDWQRVGFDFVAPKSSSASIGIEIAVKRTPRFVYDDPSLGTIWLDDFSLIEVRR